MNEKHIYLSNSEEFRPILGYEDLYSVTSFGRIYSHKKIRGCVINKSFFLKLRLDKRGYPIIRLSSFGKSKTYKVHRLVAQAYIPNPQNLPEVNHKDGNKLNNFVGTKDKNYEDGNLEWCTDEDNHNHAMIKGLKNKISSEYYGVSFKGDNYKRNKKWFARVRKDGRQIHIGNFLTEIEAAKAYNEYVIKYNLNRPLNEFGGN